MINYHVLIMKIKERNLDLKGITQDQTYKFDHPSLGSCIVDHEKKIKIKKRNFSFDSHLSFNHHKRMARTKSVARKTPAGLPRAILPTSMDQITLPSEPMEEGNLLYRQYFIKFGMTEELRNRLRYDIGWSRKDITKHVAH